MATVGLSRDTAIEAKAPEEAKVTAMMIAAWSVGSVFDFEDEFHAQKFGKGGKSCQKSQRVCWKSALA